MEIFNYAFMIRAFIVGGTIAILAPLIGTFLITKGYSLMADTLAHVCLAGIALGMFLNISPLYVSLIVVILASIAIEKVNKNKKNSSESTLALFLSGGLAIATILISLSKGFNSNLLNYLFGSITTATESDMYITIALAGVIIATVTVLYKELKYITYDEESARVSGISVDAVNNIFMILTAVTIALSIRIIGILLVSALMIIPVLTSALFSKSMKGTILTAIALSVSFVLSGLVLSYYLDLAPGGTIVLISIIVYISVRYIKNSR